MSIGQIFSAGEHAAILARDEAVAELERVLAGVTVCVPCFEQSQYLEECLESVVAQTVPVYETIVVDDGSRPDEGQRIEEICGRFGARYVRVTNRGLAAARNTAIMLTRTVAFLPLDADDWLRDDYVEVTLPLLEDADVVLTGIQEHGPTRNQAYLPGFDRPFNLVGEDVLWTYNRFFYCSLFRTDVLRKIGGYNPLMAGPWNQGGGFEDWDLWIDLVRRGVRFAASHEPLFNYNTANEGSMLSRAEKNREALVAEMRRHHSQNEPR